jgi:hypothetical protein
MMRSLWRLGIVAAMCSACSAGLGEYAKPGATDQQRATDYYDCRRDSGVLVNAGKGMQEYVVDSARLQACMSARGYTSGSR